MGWEGQDEPYVALAALSGSASASRVAESAGTSS